MLFLIFGPGRVDQSGPTSWIGPNAREGQYLSQHQHSKSTIINWSLDYSISPLDHSVSHPRQHHAMFSKIGIAFATIIRIAYATPFWKALFEAHIVVAIPNLLSIFLGSKNKMFYLLRQCFHCVPAF
jgi:hypothetical protein